MSIGSLPSRIRWRISGTQRGHSESVSRGHPSGGLIFSQDLRSGLSDHFGTNPGFWWIWFSESNTAQAALAAYVTAFSTYLIGLCIALCPPDGSVSVNMNLIKPSAPSQLKTDRCT